jgi:hypothetical protein
MQDIKIPVTNTPKKSGFEVSSIGGSSTSSGQGEAEQRHEQGERKIGEHVKVKFEKFVQLVATHDFEEVMKKHGDDDIILNSNLLTDLASAHQDEEDGFGKKLPLILVIGVVIGIVVTYLILTYK